MVLADKNYEDLKNGGGRRSGGGGGGGAEPPNSNNTTGTTLNGHISDDGSATDDSERDDIGMRVGGDYQALIPDIIYTITGNSERYPECLPEKALLVWSPSPDITETKLDEFLSASKEKFGYNAEQALGMLFWHKHDLEKAMGDLPNFTPFPDEWTVEDKVLFEQAFQFHGKSFHRIRQMLPDKSIASLVKYYYSWKKTRCRTSLMDRQARKRASQREEGRSVSMSEATSKSASSSYSIIPNTLFKTFSEVCSEDGSNSDTDGDADKDEKDNPGVAKTQCSNCNIMSSQCQSTAKGSLCSGCYQYWRHTGLMKVVSGPSKKQDLRDRHNTLKSKRKPPRGMHLSHEDLKAIALGPNGQGDAILKGMDSEVISLKRQVQNNKQIISALKHKTAVKIDDLRPQEGSTRMNARWTNEELLLAVQGVRKYGKDFKAIAELIGNKTETHLRTFFVNYRRRYNLDGILQEYEAENGPMSDEEKMDVDASPSNSASNSNSGTSTPVSSLLGSGAVNGTNTTTTTTSNSNSNNATAIAVNPPPPPPTSSSSSSSSTSVPPPLLKPVQSPSIMNRSVTRPQTQQQQTRFPGTRTAPPPLIRPNSKPIMAAMRSSSTTVHSQPPQLSTRD